MNHLKTGRKLQKVIYLQYKVSGEEMSGHHQLIPEAILSTKCYINMGLIVNGYRDNAGLCITTYADPNTQSCFSAHFKQCRQFPRMKITHKWFLYTEVVTLKTIWTYIVVFIVHIFGTYHNSQFFIQMQRPALSQ